MRLAWFRPERGPSAVSIDLAPSSTACARHTTCTSWTRAAAHDFVWQAAQGMYDLCVYELDDTVAHQYIWPYLLHYPGVLALRTSRLHDSRAQALAHQRRDADREAEMAFADGATRAATRHGRSCAARGRRGAFRCSPRASPPSSTTRWRRPLPNRVPAHARRGDAGRRTRPRARDRAAAPPLRGRCGAGARRPTTRPSRAVERAAARARDAGAGLEVVHGTVRRGARAARGGRRSSPRAGRRSAVR